MNIYTYFQPVPELNQTDEMRLLLMWRDNWRSKGFEPVVLNEHHARQHPFFAEYDAAVSKLPTVNPPAYERACFLRWLAMAQVGGGIMCDYDVFNRDQKIPTPEGKKWNKLVIYQVGANGAWVPCLVSGPADHYGEMCDRFAAYIPGQKDIEGQKPHVSDQSMIQALRENKNDRMFAMGMVTGFEMVVGYNEPGWQTAKCVHFSNGNMTPAGRIPRYQHVSALL